MKKIFKNIRKEQFLFILLFYFLISCNTDRMVVTSHIPTAALNPINPAPSYVLLLNTFDVQGKGYRENKSALFINLLNTMLNNISKELHERSDINSEIIYGRTVMGDPDSTIKEMMYQHAASHAIVITFFDIYFEQTQVVVTKDSNGTSRTAYYDIVSDIDYSLYDNMGLYKDMKMVQRRAHSSRPVLSGVLAAGPNIVKKDKDALDMAEKNLSKYLDNFFPGWEERSRSIFVGNELNAVRTAVKKGDYDIALEESLRYVNNSDSVLAAKANYNCAVFLERKKHPDEAQSYLEQSIHLSSSTEARSMMLDYGLKK